MPRGIVLIIVLCVVGMLNRTSQALLMYSLDLDSLAYLSTDVVEVDVLEVNTVKYDLVGTVRVTKTWAGNTKAGAKMVVDLSGYMKQRGNDWVHQRTMEVGDKLILFVGPAGEQLQKQHIPYDPVPSGVKVVVSDNVTGMAQFRNPGPYVNIVNDGDLLTFRETLAESIKATVEFKQQLAEKSKDADWLLGKLKERATLVEQQRSDDTYIQDHIAAVLCEALDATGDKAAVEKANQIVSGKLAERLPPTLKKPSPRPSPLATALG